METNCKSESWIKLLSLLLILGNVGKELFTLLSLVSLKFRDFKDKLQDFFHITRRVGVQQCSISLGSLAKEEALLYSKEKRVRSLHNDLKIWRNSMETVTGS